jgi:VWFA-related protein
MLDVSGSMAGNLPLLRDSAANLFAHLAAEDLARVGSFGQDVTIGESFTRDADALRASLPATIKPDAPTPLWRALDKAIDAFGDGKDDPRTAADEGARPVILVLSDGKDAPPFSIKERPASQAGVIEHARRKDVMIYAVGMRSRSRQRIPPDADPNALAAAMVADLPDPGLARVAEETGGGYVEIRFGEDLGMAFAGVVNELHSQYLLAFAPPARDGKVHGIDVRLAMKGMKARARKSYIAPKA